jgi:predicted ATPase/DNA-binding winged helix-turn-helix (wHTH) protein
VDSSFRFGRFEVCPALRQLRVDGVPVTVGARAFDMLVVLIEHRHRLVGKNELLDLVWPGLVVEEGNITVQVATLRKLVGADAIATIPGRGYRFTAQPMDEAPDTPNAPVERPLRAVPPMRTNLPEVLPPLIGRDDDLAALDALLQRHRLITITGAGGMGKTRLAERLLHDRRHQSPHGVAWVDLAGVTDPAQLPGTIAGALGLQIGSGDPLKALVCALQPMQILVALDNAEHLTDAVGQVVQALLEAAPEVQLLVTSQAPLRLPLERVYRLEALSLPELGTPLDEALQYGAVALFADRARAADRHFELGPRTLPAVIGICAQLDGLALAIELAAARVPLLGVTALAASLDERLRLLTLGRRGAPERQRTLRAALDWSHAQLNALEAASFRRLGMFVGGFTLEMARHVVADGLQLDEWGAVDALGALVDRSLVAADGAETPRYRLLESARALALEKLAAAGEGDAVRQRHAQATLQRCVGLNDASMTGCLSVDEVRLALDVELDNARAALAWMLTAGDRLGAVTLAPSLGVAFSFSRHPERARMWEATQSCLDDTLPLAVRADWASSYSAFCLSRRPEMAADWARQAATIHRSLGAAPGLYRALSNLCICTARMGQRDEAAAAYQEMTRIEDLAWAPRLKLYGTEAAFFFERFRGYFGAAHAALQRKAELAIAAGDTVNSLLMRVNVADTELHSGLVDEAVRHGRELVQDVAGTRHLHILDFARRNLTAALLAQGSLAEARETARLAWPLALHFDFKNTLADSLSELAQREGRPTAAARLLGYSDAIYAAQGGVREPNEAASAERAASGARRQLGSAEFERLRREGRVLPDGAVLALALGGHGPG